MFEGENQKTLLYSKTFCFTLSRPREEEGLPRRGGFVFGEPDLIPDMSTFDSDNLLKLLGKIIICIFSTDPDTD